MKILHVITELSAGGAQRALLNIISGGLGREFETVVVSLQTEGDLGSLISSEGVPVYCLGIRHGFPPPRVIANLSSIVRIFRPDVIQGWMYHGNIAANLAAWLSPGTPAVCWNIRHSLYELKEEKLLTRQIIRANRALSNRASAVLYNSKLSKHQHEAFGFYSGRSQVIANGFKVHNFVGEINREEKPRDELGISHDIFVVGHVARYHPIKDHASFIKAAIGVAQKIPNAKFLMIGRHVTAGNSELLDIIPEKLRDRFIFAGERNDVRRLIQAMDIFCLSSWSEAFPNVLGEAMVCYLPCVSTDVGDCADIIGDTGILVSPSNSNSLEQGLLEMIEKSPEERQALGKRARERIEKLYELSSIVAKYSQLYKTLDNNPKG